jgi:hypothetical protein
VDKAKRPISVSEVSPGLSARQRTRRRRYLVLMGICIGLIVPAWTVVRLVSVPAAVAMSLVAAVIPPIAAIVANPLRDD